MHDSQLQDSTLKTALGATHQRSELSRRLDEPDLRALFLKIADALPHGRAGLRYEYAFTNAARETKPINPKGLDLYEVCAEVMEAAIDTRDARVMLDAQAAITAYFDALEHKIFARVPQAEAAAIATVLVQSLKEGAEACAAIGEAGTTRSPAAMQRAQVEIREAQVLFGHAAHAIDRQLRMGSRQPMHA